MGRGGNPTEGRCLLGIDVGQTAVKAVIHTAELCPVAVGHRASPVDRSTRGHAERSQQELWDAVADAISDAIRVSGISPTSVAAVGIAGHGDGLHVLSTRGLPLTPAINAMDSRAHREASELAEDPERSRLILDRTGQVPTAGSVGHLLRHLLRADPGLLNGAGAVLSCKDTIRYRLTGTLGTDYSDACASFLDLATAQWSAEVVAAYGLPPEVIGMLPPITHSADIVGTVTDVAAERTGLAVGTPVIAGMHDVQAAAIGMAALTPGLLSIAAGSFNTNGVTTTQTDIDPRWQSRLSITPDLRIAMSTSATAAPALEWMLTTLGATTASARTELFARASHLSPETSVPLVLPFFYDSPYGAHVPASLTGVRGWHESAHMLRGVLEGIALMHVWHTRALAERFSWGHPIMLGGGLAKSPLYVQLVANALRAPVSVVVNDEPGALGAAALAGVAVGVLDSLAAAQQLVDMSAEIEPTAASADYWADVCDAFDSLIGDRIDQRSTVR